MSSTLTAEQVKLFRRIPLKTHTQRLLRSFPNSFTGKEAHTFLMTTFDFSSKDAEKWGSLLIQAGVIKGLNYRLTSTFKSKDKFIYGLGPLEEENLFWLENDDEEAEQSMPASIKVLDTADFSKLQGLKEIPEIPALPFVGNAFDVAGPLDSNRSMCILGREVCAKNGGIFRLALMGQHYIVVSDPDIVQQVFESPHFGKATETDAIFKELRSFRGEGLTTVSDGPLHDQCQAMIAPQLIKNCFERYVPIIADTMNQCFREEFGKQKSNVDMKVFWKKCTLRTVGKIAMGIDLYDGSKWKKFNENLTYVADEAINRVFKGTRMIPFFSIQFRKAVKMMHKKILQVVKSRRQQHEIHGKDPNTFDLLDLMLTTPLRVDESGRKIMMSDEIIRANITTILSAGHSTTTSMLSWTCNFLYDNSLGNSDFRYNLIQEISNVSGGDRRYVPTVQDVYKNLSFMTCVLKETLRMCPPIPTIVRHCLQSTNLAGYRVAMGENIMISCLGTHLHPKSFDNARVYDPYRFMNALEHPCSFIPWAGGPRQCVGREFALLTGRIGLFLLMNQYSLELSPNARVSEDEHLFVFPQGLLMNGIIRKDMIRPVANSPMAEKTGSDTPEPASPSGDKKETASAPSESRAWDGLKALIRETGHKVTIVCGTKTEAGNTNTVAQLLLEKALSFNFQTGDSPMPADDYIPTIKESPSKFTILALCLSTYQGNPAPNAKNSQKWLKDLLTRLESGEKGMDKYLENVRYFVFGCGNRNWATTYQKVAKYFDSGLEKLGAKRICPIGLFDESQDDLEEEFALFYKVMAPALMHSLPEIGDKRLRAVDASSIISAPAVQAQAASSAYQFDILGDADDGDIPPIIPSTVKKDIFSCRIRNIMDLTPRADKSTIHLELEMREGMKYRAGDHLVVCPKMPSELVDRVLSRFLDFDETTIVRWSPRFGGDRRKTMARFNLPVSVSMTIENIFTNLLDLKAIPSKQFLVNLSTIVEDPEHEKQLKEIAEDLTAYKKWIQEYTPVSNIDVIERYPPKSSELGRLMEILPVIKPRPYSICSSPKIDSTTVHICVGVVEDTFPQEDVVYQGVSSYYIKSLLDETDSSVNVYIEPADELFNVPEDNSKPIILISAGTGFAPMRSFLQERKARNAPGENYVFFGCRNENTDLLYCDEMEKYRKEGLITGWFKAYSRSSKYPKEYIQVKILEQADLLWDAIDNKGAYIYVCGSGSRVGAGTRDALLKIIAEKSKKGTNFAEDYISHLESSGRYEQDVWG